MGSLKAPDRRMSPRFFVFSLFLLVTILQKSFSAPIDEDARMKRSPTCPTCGSDSAGGQGGAGAEGAGRAGGAGGAGGAEGDSEKTPVWCKFTNPFRSRVRVDEKCKELGGV